MRALLVLAVLLGGSAFAQSKCQQRCLAGDTCGECQDDRCIKRCSARTQACMEACEKSDPESTAGKQVKLTGTCPGPGGRKLPCDQSPQKAPSQADLQNMMLHPPTKPKNREKDEGRVPHTMPTADNYQQLVEEHNRQKGH